MSLPSKHGTMELSSVLESNPTSDVTEVTEASLLHWSGAQAHRPRNNNMLDSLEEWSNIEQMPNMRRDNMSPHKLSKGDVLSHLKLLMSCRSINGCMVLDGTNGWCLVKVSMVLNGTLVGLLTAMSAVCTIVNLTIF